MGLPHPAAAEPWAVSRHFASPITAKESLASRRKRAIMKVTVEWDSLKAEVNLKKHQVSFEEASTVFDDPLFITFLDVEHSLDEERYITLGLSQRNRLLLVAHAECGDAIRIISARKATKNERRFYEEAE
jgi:uncharacterized DUF497 family protein